MYRVRRDDPQELSVFSGVRCKIRILKILCSILLFRFFHNFFLINNVINKHITPNILFIKFQKLHTCTSMCSKLVAHFGPISEMLPIFPSQPLDAWQPLTRGRESQERHSIRNSMLRPYLPSNCRENKIK